MPSTANLELSTLLQKITTDYPELSFVESAHFSWHAGKKHVSYQIQPGQNHEHSMWALLHELGHALLDHHEYTHDIELLQLEVAAWEHAQKLADTYHLQIDDNYIQDCLDTYRDWLHLRATCPACFSRSLQSSATQYRCFNCQTQWQVTRSRLCRPYRTTKKSTVRDSQ